MKHTLRPLIEEVERAIVEATRHFGLSVDPDNLVVTIQSKGRKPATGWYCDKVWKNKETVLSEICITAEHLTYEITGMTLLHELAHAENASAGIKDCSGNVHNKKFAAQAEKLGLLVLERDPSVGFGHTELSPEGEAFLNSINFSRDVFNLCRQLKENVEKEKVETYKFKCKCETKISTQFENLDANCETCGLKFEIIEKKGGKLGEEGSDEEKFED